MITFCTQKSLRLFKNVLYLVILSSSNHFDINVQYLFIILQLTENIKKKPIYLIIMSMNLLKICDIGMSIFLHILCMFKQFCLCIILFWTMNRNIAILSLKRNKSDDGLWFCCHANHFHFLPVVCTGHKLVLIPL